MEKLVSDGRIHPSRVEDMVEKCRKEVDVAIGTTGRNSAVVHAGFNNRPGSLMAKLFATRLCRHGDDITLV